MHRTLQGEDKMTGSMWKGVAVLLLCAAISFGWSYEFVRSAKGAIQMIDFGAIYYGAQCGIHHIDPYGPGGALREFRSEGGRRTGEVLQLPSTCFQSFCLLPVRFDASS